MKNINEVKKALEAAPARSAWKKGVKIYALELLEELAEGIEAGYIDSDIFESSKLLEKALLNGAYNWSAYSWGGCSLIYDHQIAARLCNPSELKRTRDGYHNPNSREQWLDVQARALAQAYIMILFTAKEV